jgi:extradiol dioxygenase family protein
MATGSRAFPSGGEARGTIPGVYPSFHLSIGVASVGEEAAFFEDVLQATISHRDPSGYVNVDFFGAQITLQRGGSAGDGEFHFGVNLPMEDFDRLAAHVTAAGRAVAPPQVAGEGTPLERKKLYLRSPSGYLIELKGYGSE